MLESGQGPVTPRDDANYGVQIWTARSSLVEYGYVNLCWWKRLKLVHDTGELPEKHRHKM